MAETIPLRMAKASREDIVAALEVAGILDAIEKGYYPAREGDEDAPTFFDHHNQEHMIFLLDRLLDAVSKGSLFRVAGGLEMLLSDRNAVVDPDVDHIALHPRFAACDIPPDGFPVTEPPVVKSTSSHELLVWAPGEGWMQGFYDLFYANKGEWPWTGENLPSWKRKQIARWHPLPGDPIRPEPMP